VSVAGCRGEGARGVARPLWRRRPGTPARVRLGVSSCAAGVEMTWKS
jgi:hypothetical protein